MKWEKQNLVIFDFSAFHNYFKISKRQIITNLGLQNNKTLTSFINPNNVAVR